MMGFPFLAVAAVVSAVAQGVSTVQGLTRKSQPQRPEGLPTGPSAPPLAYGRGAGERARLQALQALEQYGPKPIK